MGWHVFDVVGYMHETCTVIARDADEAARVADPILLAPRGYDEDDDDRPGYSVYLYGGWFVRDVLVEYPRMPGADERDAHCREIDTMLNLYGVAAIRALMERDRKCDKGDQE